MDNIRNTYVNTSNIINTSAMEQLLSFKRPSNVLTTTAYCNKIMGALNNTIQSNVATKVVPSYQNMMSSALMSQVSSAVEQFNNSSMFLSKVLSLMGTVAISNQIKDMSSVCINDVAMSIKNVTLSSVKYMENLMVKHRDIIDHMLFMHIADEMGFPIYLESDTELKERLLDSYRKNDRNCNREEMIQIILDYCNDAYVEAVFRGIENVQLFDRARVQFIKEGMLVYQEGHYAASGALFATQMSGMIADIYKVLNRFHRYTPKEREELLEVFEQKCKAESEKGMLIQIASSQDKGALYWYRVTKYILNVTYSSKEDDMTTQPKRHKICHGIQLNYNTREMNLKLIQCMDIIAELGYRVEQMYQCSTNNIEETPIANGM